MRFPGEGAVGDGEYDTVEVADEDEYAGAGR